MTKILVDTPHTMRGFTTIALAATLGIDAEIVHGERDTVSVGSHVEAQQLEELLDAWVANRQPIWEKAKRFGIDQSDT